MSETLIDRRAALALLASALAVALMPAPLRAASISLHVVKDPNCSCCAAWIKYLEPHGFTAEVELMEYEALQAHKAESGIPETMASCHTAHVEGYVIEGHVPPDDIRRLLAEQPDAVGLAVPGMPYGSPGMGPESEREAYEVHLIRRDGSTEIFSSYDAAA